MTPVRKRRRSTFQWTCECARCGRSWTVLADEKPERCPSCKIKHWERPPLWRKPRPKPSR